MWNGEETYLKTPKSVSLILMSSRVVRNFTSLKSVNIFSLICVVPPCRHTNCTVPRRNYTLNFSENVFTFILFGSTLLSNSFFFIATKTIFACIVIFVPKTCYVAQNDKQFLLSWLSNWYLICWAFHNCLRVKYTHSAVVSVTFIVVVARRFCLTQNRITDTRSTNNDNDLCSANIFQSTEKNFFFHSFDCDKMNAINKLYRPTSRILERLWARWAEVKRWMSEIWRNKIED